MKAFARVANFATVQLENGKGGNSCNTREPSSGRRRAGAPSTTSRCPLLDACQALAKIFANFVPSRKYMKCGIILSTVFLSPASARTKKEPVAMILFVSVGSCEYTIRVLGKDGDQEKPATNRLISFDLCFVSSVNS